MLPTRTDLPDVTPIDVCSWCHHRPLSKPAEGKEGWTIGCEVISETECHHGWVHAENRRAAIVKYNRWNKATANNKQQFLDDLQAKKDTAAKKRGAK